MSPRASDERSPERAAAALTRALELWRGEPYPDLPDLASAQTERRRLVEQRMAAIEALAEARLALGQHAAMIGWLHELVAAHPLRERLWGLLMRALYRGGRQAEALAAFARLRATLVEELGADPTPGLQALHERILRHEEETPPRPARGPRLGAPPLHLTRLVGRDREITYLTSALGSHRLVTLTGPAGSGKTRIAAELFDRYTTGRHDGDACFVELAGVTDPNRVASASPTPSAWASSPAAGSPSCWPTAWPPAGCCWCSTTANTCSTPRPTWSRAC